MNRRQQLGKRREQSRRQGFGLAIYQEEEEEVELGLGHGEMERSLVERGWLVGL